MLPLGVARANEFTGRRRDTVVVDVVVVVDPAVHVHVRKGRSQPRSDPRWNAGFVRSGTTHTIVKVIFHDNDLVSNTLL